MSIAAVQCHMKARWREKRAFSLTELMCVTAIISILAAFYLGAVTKAYAKILAILHDLGW